MEQSHAAIQQVGGGGVGGGDCLSHFGFTFLSQREETIRPDLSRCARA